MTRKRKKRNWRREKAIDKSVEKVSETAQGMPKGLKITLIALGSLLGILCLVYVGFILYFQSHFLFYTKINGNDFSLKSVKQVEGFMKKQVEGYTLTLKESDGSTEEIKGTDISLEYVKGEELNRLVKKQDSLFWIKSLWKHPKITAKVGVSYQDSRLESVIKGLRTMKPENQKPSADAHPTFQEDRFVVAPEVVGTEVNTEQFNKEVRKAIDGFQPKLDMVKKGCYILPKYLSDSKEVIQAVKDMNTYLGAQITYDLNPVTEVVNSAVISQWIKVDENMQASFDEEAVRGYVQSLAEKYDTKGKPRNFTTATGEVVTVEGGSYGWKINQEAEYEALLADIKNGTVVTREPNYSSRAASHSGNDVGSTYAEVNLTTQMMYYIQNGQVVLESPIVTGNINRGWHTPQGVYTVSYKTRNAVLRGRKLEDGKYEYESPVQYWVPFNGDIGFHDASWQPTFGGNWYLQNGSRGCVNMPPDKAGQMYDLISAGIPVVCHF